MTCFGVYSVSHQLDQVCCWCFLHYSFIHSGVCHLISALESVWLFLHGFSLSVKLPRLPVLYSWLHWVVSLCCLSAHWASLKQLFWILCQGSLISIYFGSVSGKLLCSTGGIIFPWFFREVGVAFFTYKRSHHFLLAFPTGSGKCLQQSAWPWIPKFSRTLGHACSPLLTPLRE